MCRSLLLAFYYIFLLQLFSCIHHIQYFFLQIYYSDWIGIMFIQIVLPFHSMLHSSIPLAPTAPTLLWALSENASTLFYFLSLASILCTPKGHPAILFISFILIFLLHDFSLEYLLYYSLLWNPL